MRYLILFLSIGFLISSAGAESNVVTVVDSLELRELEVEALFQSKINFPLVEIDRSEIKQLMVVSPADILSRKSGLSLVKDGAWATSVNIRGLNESKLLLLYNGDRAMSGTDLAGTAALIEPELLGTIEVIKGAASVLYGSGALGGVVNCISYRPEFSSIRSVGTEINAGFQSVNNMFSTSAKTEITDEDWFLFASGSYRNAGNTNTPEGEIANSQFNDASWNFAGGKKLGDNQKFLVNYDHFHAWNVGLPGGSVFPATALAVYKSFERNHLNGEYEINSISRTLKALKIKGFTQEITRDVENKVSASKIILPSSKNVSSGIKVLADLYFNDYNTMTVGTEFWMRDAETARLNISMSSDTFHIGEQPVPSARMYDAGLFGNYKLVIDPRYWNLGLGMRLDWIYTQNDKTVKEVFKYEFTNGEMVELTPNSQQLFASGVHQDISYAAHADLEFRPAKNQSFILSLANAYRVASLEERFKYIDLAGTLSVGNPDLKPEKSASSNLSYKYTLSNFVLSVDVFANYIYDLIAEELLTRSVNGVLQNYFKLNNIDQALIAGAEMEMRWKMNDFLFNTNVSYASAKDLSTGDVLFNTPPLQGFMDINYQLPANWSLLADAKWAYEVRNLEEGIEPSKYMVFGCYARSPYLEFGAVKLNVLAGVSNLLNKNYKEYFSSYRGINQMEAGRSFNLKVNVEL